MAEAYNSNQEAFEEDSVDTLMQKKEVINVVTKIKYTIFMIPGDREEAIEKLKDWDLWGPLFICFIFTIGIGIQANSQYVYDSFVNVFLIFWIGSFLASINCRLLGNKGSIFQSISVIGYCMLPLTILGFLVAIMPNSAPSLLKLLLVLAGLVWSAISCLMVMRDLVSQTKKYLCSYPILLFYIFLAWYAIVA